MSKHLNRRSVLRGALAGTAAACLGGKVAAAVAQQSHPWAFAIKVAGPDGPMLAAYFDFLRYQRAFNAAPVSADEPDDDGPYLELERLRAAVMSHAPQTPYGMSVLALMLLWDSTEVAGDADIMRDWDGISEPPPDVMVDNNIALWSIAHCGWLGMGRA